LLHDQARRDRHGSRDQPIDRRGPWRAALGRAEPAPWCSLSIDPAGRGEIVRCAAAGARLAGIRAARDVLCRDNYWHMNAASLEVRPEVWNSALLGSSSALRSWPISPPASPNFDQFLT